MNWTEKRELVACLDREMYKFALSKNTLDSAEGRLAACLGAAEGGIGGWGDVQRKNYTHLLADWAIFSLLCLSKGWIFMAWEKKKKKHNYRKPELYNFPRDTLFCLPVRSTVCPLNLSNPIATYTTPRSSTLDFFLLVSELKPVCTETSGKDLLAGGLAHTRAPKLCCSG